MDRECASKLAVLSLLEVQDPCKDQMCSGGQLTCKDHDDFQVESLDYSPCVVDVDIEKDDYRMLISNGEKNGNARNEGLLSVSENSLVFSTFSKRKITFMSFVSTWIIY